MLTVIVIYRHLALFHTSIVNCYSGYEYGTTILFE